MKFMNKMYRFFALITMSILFTAGSYCDSSFSNPLTNWKEWTDRNRVLDAHALDETCKTVGLFNSPTDHPTKGKLKGKAKNLLTSLLLSTQADAHQDLSYTPKTWADMHGTQPETMKDIVEHLKNPKKYPCKKAVMFHGPPGTGKTLGAKVVAGESGAIFYHANASEFINKYVGVGAANLRDLFAHAEQDVKDGYSVVVFIDEIELLCAARGENMNGESHQALNQFLALLTYFQDNYKDLSFIFIGATNHKENIDPAAYRRFELAEIGLPDEATRFAILKEKALAAGVNINDKLFNSLAKQTKDFNNAEVEHIISSAQKRACKNDKERFNASDINAVLPELKKQQKERVKHEQEQERRKKAREYIEEEQLKQMEIQKSIRILTFISTAVGLARTAWQHADKISGPVIAAGKTIAEWLPTGNPPAPPAA